MAFGSPGQRLDVLGRLALVGDADVGEAWEGNKVGNVRTDRWSMAFLVLWRTGTDAAVASLSLVLQSSTRMIGVLALTKLDCRRRRTPADGVLMSGRIPVIEFSLVNIDDLRRLSPPPIPPPTPPTPPTPLALIGEFGTVMVTWLWLPG